MNLRSASAIALCIVSANACGKDRADAAPAGPSRIAPVAFADAFTLVDSVELQQSDSALIVRVSGIDVDSSGSILLGDVSEGNVKLFGADGRLLRIIGRKGEGPGEFKAPRYPRFGPGGLIYVADGQEGHVQVFDRAGALRRFVRLAEVGMLMGMAVRDDGSFLVATDGTEKSPNVLIHFDTAGARLKEFLPIRGVRPTGQADNPLWANVRNYFLDVRGDTAFVTSTVSDTVWSVHLPTGRESRARLSFPGYVRPSPPSSPPPDIPSLVKWGNSFHLGSTLSVDGGRIYLPYVQGVLNYGDPMLLLLRDERGGWTVASGAPPIIAAANGRAYGLLTPNQERVVLGLFAPKAR
ncbi:MAG TPA: 6-bladed beta-propeller [Longimicrobium sp.]|nr:6-bladed beta-propeller [Longimicrobium sp.]